MLRLIHRQISFFSKLNIQKFNKKDYQTMCLLMKQKYPVYNDAIQVKSDVKLLDENGKLVGRYEASEARKKAANLQKDIILINDKTVPVICKLMPFRDRILNNFYNEIVVKKNQQLIKKASSTKHLKISLKLTDNDLIIKGKQIIQLAKKNLNVRIFINCKLSQVDQACQKLDTIKAMLQNQCIIEKDMNVSQDAEDQEDTENKTNQEEPRRTVMIIVKSKSNEMMQMIADTSAKDPDSIIQMFLKRFYKQEDIDMKDLKAKISGQSEQILSAVQLNETDNNNKNKKKSAKTQQRTQILDNPFQLQDNKQFLTPNQIRDKMVAMQAGKSRLLAQRLKRILEVEIK